MENTFVYVGMSAETTMMMWRFLNFAHKLGVGGKFSFAFGSLEDGRYKYVLSYDITNWDELKKLVS